jgi:hypothetical protein
MAFSNWYYSDKILTRLIDISDTLDLLFHDEIVKKKEVREIEERWKQKQAHELAVQLDLPASKLLVLSRSGFSTIELLHLASDAELFAHYNIGMKFIRKLRMKIAETSKYGDTNNGG